MVKPQIRPVWNDLLRKSGKYWIAIGAYPFGAGYLSVPLIGKTPSMPLPIQQGRYSSVICITSVGLFG